MSVAQTARPGFGRRWSQYLAERFPPLQHGLLIAAFSYGMMRYAAALAQPAQPPGWLALGVMFGSVFLIMLQLRVLDEFKDYEDDARWRPSRPVPRGLVTLAELRGLWFCAAGLQLAGAWLLDARLIYGLLVIWLYSGLMGVEFFVRDWLKAHALAYMLSHIVIVPMIAAYAAAGHWLPLGLPMPSLATLLGASYFGFCVIEIGRKIRAPEDEQQGVETYTFLWGARRALMAWLAFMLAGSALALLAAAQVGALLPVLLALGTTLVLAVAAAVAFLRNPRPGAGSRFNLLSGLWTLALFLSIGLGAAG